MKRTALISMVETLGYTPEVVSALILRPDEVEVREKTGGVWYFEYPGVFPASNFDKIDEALRNEAPTDIWEQFDSIRFDFRGVSARVPSGIEWRWPWEGENHE